MFVLLVPLALAAGPRLLLVGDTGEDTAVSHVVAADLAAAQREADVILALGDFNYDAPPVEAPDCTAQLVTNYRKFFGGLDPRKIVPVLGNHDVTTAAQDSFSPAARDCTVAAWRALGWVNDEAAFHVRKVDRGGVRVDLAVVDAGFYGSGAARPSLTFRPKADWRFYAAHYAWRSAVGKCEERDKIPVTWLGKPPMHAWLNGHAHHLEAVDVEGVLALTSGAGKEMRKPKVCEGVGSLFVYTRATDEAIAGWLQVDVLSADALQVTPRVCTLEGCTSKPAMACTKGSAAFSLVCQPTEAALAPVLAAPPPSVP
jgi:hypothetical protein